VSSFKGREKCNDYSVGIELEGTDKTAFTDAQYSSLDAVLKGLLNHYGELTPAKIVGHSDIAPGRKTDPGIGFDWQRVKSSLGLN
jgi:AmpD protein